MGQKQSIENNTKIKNNSDENFTVTWIVDDNALVEDHIETNVPLKNESYIKKEDEIEEISFNEKLKIVQDEGWRKGSNAAHNEMNNEIERILRSIDEKMTNDEIKKINELKEKLNNIII